MKQLFLIFFLLNANHLFAQNQVKVNISNFENNKGVCHACIFNSAASFEKMEALRCVTTPVQNKSAQVQFDDLPDGSYAIFVFHDENKNSKMDKNFLGIPKEGYGASGNKLPFAAAPRFAENKFSLNKQSSISIAIRLRNI